MLINISTSHRYDWPVVCETASKLAIVLGQFLGEQSRKTSPDCLLKPIIKRCWLLDMQTKTQTEHSSCVSMRRAELRDRRHQWFALNPY